MTPTRMLSRRACLCVGALGLLAAAVAMGVNSCGTTDRHATNQPPRVEIIGSPVEGDSVNYVVDFQWAGWDGDGAVVRSEYAIDIPTTFTPEQINDPNTPGIEWTSTTVHHARIRFRVGAPDTAGADTYASDVASAPHTFFVRAFDNAGAPSLVDERSFNAWTVLPRTTITAPSFIGNGYVLVRNCLKLSWTGLDADGPAPEHRPAHTEYKLVPVRSIIGITDPYPVLNGAAGAPYPWVRLPDDSTTVTRNIAPPSAGVLALRSIDEAGGVESRFEFGRNALLLQSGSMTFEPPPLVIREPLLGSAVFPDGGELVDFEIFTGQCLNFELSTDPYNPGGVTQEYRWCVDSAEDPATAGDVPGCGPWGSTRQAPPICFSTPGIHTVGFAVRGLDACGEFAGSTQGMFRFHVLPRYFDRDVLYVDDYFKPRDPSVPQVTDDWTDQRFLAALRTAGFESVDRYDAWGPGDLEGAVAPLTLERLSHYRLIFWSVLGAGGGSQNGNTALLQASACASSRVLRTYLAAGGAVWINGEMVFGALKDRSGNLGTCVGTTAYSPDAGLSFAPGDFVADFLHITGGDFRDAKTTATTNGLLRARPTARALAEGLPLLEADSTTYAYQTLGGLPLYDAMFQPTFAGEGGLDTLYVAETAKATSVFNQKPIAWRYADPNPTPRQGAVAITSFPLQKMKVGAVRQEANGVRVPGTGVNGLVQVMRDWFRAHDATSRGASPLPVTTQTHVRARY